MVAQGAWPGATRGPLSRGKLSLVMAMPFLTMGTQSVVAKPMSAAGKTRM
jgi:hypothetical protein